MRTPQQLLRDTKPFPSDVIDSAGSGRTFVSWSQYNQHMLAAHPGHDYEVTSVSYAPPFIFPLKDDDGNLTDQQGWQGPVWAVAVSLVIEGSRYDGVGSSDDPLSAESNAYKRACSHAGVGLHLYENHPKRNPYWLHATLLAMAEAAAGPAKDEAEAPA